MAGTDGRAGSLGGGQRCLGDGRHRGRLAGGRDAPDGTDVRLPRAARTSLYGDFEVVPRPDDGVLGLLVPHVRDVHVVHPDDGVADQEARPLRQAASVHLLYKKWLSKIFAALKPDAPR